MRRLAAFALCALAPTCLPAAEGLAWLKIPQGARSVALGTALSAQAGGAEAQWYTPAALAGQESLEFSVSRQAWLGQTRDDFAAVAVPLGPGGLGIYGNLLATEDVTRDAYGNAGAKFSDNAWAAGLGYGFRVGWLSAGVAGKMVQENLAGRQAFGSGLDAGLQLRLGAPWLRLGLALQNVGYVSGYSYASGHVELPRVYRAGLAVDQAIPGVLLSAELRQMPFSRETSFLAGFEYARQAGNWGFALRSGYEGAAAKVGDLGGLAVGAGLSFGGLKVDFAYTPYGALGDPYRMTLGWDFGAGRGSAKAAPALAPLTPRQQYARFLELYKQGRKAEAIAALEAKLAQEPDATQADWLKRYKAQP